MWVFLYDMIAMVIINYPYLEFEYTLENIGVSYSYTISSIV